MRVLVVDDQAPFRLAAAAIVRATDGFELVGQVGTGEDAVTAAAALRPDLVLMDLVLPGIDGAAATSRIRRAEPRVLVLLLSTYDGEDVGAIAQECGATAFVRKESFGPDVLLGLYDGTGSG